MRPYIRNAFLAALLTAVALSAADSIAAPDPEFAAAAQQLRGGQVAAGLAKMMLLADKGDAAAQYVVLNATGNMMMAGETSRGQLSAAARGEPAAMFNAGLIYQFGIGVPKSLTDAANWYRRAAEKGDSRGYVYMGRLYDSLPGSDSKPPFEPSVQKALEWYQKAAEAKNAHGLFNQALTLKVDLKRPPADYIGLLKAASDGGYPPAMLELTKAYLAGEGVSVSRPAALALAKQAAAAGSGGAIVMLGREAEKAGAAGEAWELYRRAAEMPFDFGESSVAMARMLLEKRYVPAVVADRNWVLSRLADAAASDNAEAKALVASMPRAAPVWSNHERGGIKSGRYYAIAIDKRGARWFASGGGAYRFDGRSWTRFTRENTSGGLPDNEVRAVTIDRQGDVWLGTAGGLAKFNGKSWTHFDRKSTNGGMVADPVTALAVDKRGHLWVAASDERVKPHVHGVSRFDGATWRPYSFETTNETIGSDVRAIGTDSAGNVWFSVSAGVVKFNGSSWATISDARSYRRGEVHKESDPVTGPASGPVSIDEDRSGNVWFVQIDRVTKFDGSRWTTYMKPRQPIPESNEEYFTQGGTVEADGTVWTASEEGIFKLKGGDWTYFRKRDESPNPATGRNSSDYRMRAIVVDAEGYKWVGAGNTVLSFNDGRWTEYNYENSQTGLLSDTVNDIAVDAKGSRWYATEDGVARQTGNAWTSFTSSSTAGAIPQDPINKIAVDAQGVVWAGTTEKGLVSFDGRTWTTYTTVSTRGGLPSNKITAIAFDNHGNKWIGTENGLARFDGRAWTSYTYESSGSQLSGNKVSSIAVEANGDVWVGTQSEAVMYGKQGGVSRFDGKTWSSWTEGNSALNSNNVTSIAIDRFGTKWIATRANIFRNSGGQPELSPSGLASMTGRFIEVYDNKNTNGILPDETLHSVSVDARGVKWVGTESGVVRFDGNAWTRLTPQNTDFALPRPLIKAVAVDLQNHKLFAPHNTSRGFGVAELED